MPTPSKRRQYNLAYRSKNREELCRYAIWNNCKDRAKKKGLEFTLKRDDIVVPEFCPILGIKMEVGFQNGRDNSPSVDRIFLDQGYTPENIQVISYLANKMKSNATLEQIILLGKWAENKLKEI